MLAFNSAVCWLQFSYCFIHSLVFLVRVGNTLSHKIFGVMWEFMKIQVRKFLKFFNKGDFKAMRERMCWWLGGRILPKNFKKDSEIKKSLLEEQQQQLLFIQKPTQFQKCNFFQASEFNTFFKYLLT